MGHDPEVIGKSGYRNLNTRRLNIGKINTETSKHFHLQETLGLLMLTLGYSEALLFSDPHFLNGGGKS